MTDDIVARLRDWAECEDDILIEAAFADFHAAADEIERLRAAIQRQANAVKTLQACEETEINRLRKTHRMALVSERTLDSERAANALLTDEIERLRAVLIPLVEFVEYARDDRAFIKHQQAYHVTVSAWEALYICERAKTARAVLAGEKTDD